MPTNHPSRMQPAEEPPIPDLSAFANNDFDRGASKLKELIWIFVSALFFRSFIPGNAHRRWLLRMFGAKVGHGVVIKPGVHVKFPWKFVIGEHSWIGENAWIDNLAEVVIGANACISQGVYLCTGSHDWSSRTFDLITQPITIEDGAWVAAKSVVAPGVKVGAGAVVPLGRVIKNDVPTGTIFINNDDQRLRKINV